MGQAPHLGPHGILQIVLACFSIRRKKTTLWAALERLKQIIELRSFIRLLIDVIVVFVEYSTML